MSEGKIDTSTSVHPDGSAISIGGHYLDRVMASVPEWVSSSERSKAAFREAWDLGYKDPYSRGEYLAEKYGTKERRFVNGEEIQVYRLCAADLD